MSLERKNNFEFVFATYRGAVQQSAYLGYQSKNYLNHPIHSQVSIRLSAILHPKTYQNIPKKNALSRKDEVKQIGLVVTTVRDVKMNYVLCE